MLVIEIGENKYNLAEGWEEISVRKFERIIKHSQFLSEYKSQTLFALEMFSILLDAPLEEVKRLNKESFSILSDKCAWVNGEVKPSNKIEFQINGDLYIAMKDFNTLSMGDAVSLELIINDSSNDNMIGNILPVLVRKAKPIIKNGETKLVAEDFNDSEYSELKELFLDNLMIVDVIGLKDFFLGIGK